MALAKTTAQFDQVPVNVFLASGSTGPATVAFVAPLQLSADDLWAALWYGVGANETTETLADLEYVRELVADSIVNGGLDHAVDGAHAQIRRMVPGSPEHVWALELREIARRAFAPVLDAQAPAGRALAGVA